MIGLIDYGMGNLHSVAKALEVSGGAVTIVREPERLKNFERLVLPGVGAFRDCIGTLKERGLDEALLERIEAGVPYLGICLGMQVLMEASLEFGHYQGLGLIPGQVRPFPESHPERGFKIPHMGWNDVVLPSGRDPHPVLASLGRRQVYFVHSYVCMPQHENHILAATSYGDYPFASAIGRDNIIGVQFHPEKSQAAGLGLLEAFIQWKP
ncbi:MAG TPA: imidazole glycerol phosphate synthase subunit HisH [Mariprofundaceae bacterium]|nr:imidazole glycerol phosphate synthase subunit HisH [Mariprofundaceae bacterium]